MNKNNSIIFLLLSLVIIPFGVQAKNKIDSLVTDAQVESFVRTLHPGYKEFALGRPDTLYYDSTFQQFIRDRNIKNRDTADLDGNHQTDLIVIGTRIPGYSICIVVIDTGNGYDVISMGGDYGDPSIIALDNQNRHLLHEYFGRNWWGKPTYIVDSLLTYKFGSFVEYTVNHNSKPITKIDLATTFCYGACPVFELCITDEGAVYYNARHYNPDTGSFKSRVDKSKFREMVVILNYINVDSLNDKYDIGATDYPTYYLTVTYEDGTSRRIEDYGGSGTYGLVLVYSKFYEIRRDVNWQECK